MTFETPCFAKVAVNMALLLNRETLPKKIRRSKKFSFVKAKKYREFNETKKSDKSELIEKRRRRGQKRDKE